MVSPSQGAMHTMPWKTQAERAPPMQPPTDPSLLSNVKLCKERIMKFFPVFLTCVARSPPPPLCAYERVRHEHAYVFVPVHWATGPLTGPLPTHCLPNPRCHALRFFAYLHKLRHFLEPPSPLSLFTTRRFDDGLHWTPSFARKNREPSPFLAGFGQKPDGENGLGHGRTDELGTSVFSAGDSSPLIISKGLVHHTDGPVSCCSLVDYLFARLWLRRHHNILVLTFGFGLWATDGWPPFAHITKAGRQTRADDWSEEEARSEKAVNFLD
ncbi:hypothetical protein PG993_006441 [Apiospora rasikravindrae]|uniref:Uncharacterized protein n=1 Tax=Apiospora rasikravindrae TaxID=990691 RepID=A0ABR1T5P6_9PEZI